MGFDREACSALARTVGQVRERLKSDIMDQLRRLGFQADGTTLDITRISGLSDRDFTAGQEIRALLDHFVACEFGMTAERQRTAYDRLVREIGFTTLNRLVALRMAEEHDLIIETVRNGFTSAGFQLFERMTNGALGSRAETYRAYVESMYDELAQDLPLLFNRSDPESLIFPSERCLGDVLNLLNDVALAHLWREDEAIGWVYQYYNDPAERKKMREFSAPRSSRELAVRNQFFTPRYVVEFLTDNTLGRIWYEMRQGATRLKDECRYLVRGPDEVFLSAMTAADNEHASAGCMLLAQVFQEGTEESFRPFDKSLESIQKLVEMAHCVDGYERHPFEDNVDGEWWPWWAKRRVSESITLESFSTQDLLDVLFATARADRFGEVDDAFDDTDIRIGNEVRRRVLALRNKEVSQGELLRLPVFVPFRSRKDPRHLKVLDPACGSGHFLLYAFDLLVTIYEEAWNDDETPVSEVTGRNLRGDYSDLDSLRRAVPDLILRHNLHGIDIDSRACQIAGLSLWLRAQRYYQSLRLSHVIRPRISKSNVVCAEAMPGEQEMLEEFLKDIDSRLRPLVRTIWEKMQMAGEAGSLLKIEEEISDILAAARLESLVDALPVQLTMFEQGQPARQLIMEFASLEERYFWDQAESELLLALQTYSKQLNDRFSTKRRLFAEDAVSGFAFIDVSRKRFDIVLMNPPFGDASVPSKSYIVT